LIRTIKNYYFSIQLRQREVERERERERREREGSHPRGGVGESASINWNVARIRPLVLLVTLV
jgi:hypothetical protein